MTDARARALTLLALSIAISTIASAERGVCLKDGLFPDYDKDCKDYIKCSGGVILARYSCPPKRVFDPVEGSCVPRSLHGCVRRLCSVGDALSYVAPGTYCRRYYRCENGTAIERACPLGSWFHFDLQACSPVAATCFEPICAGLPDGTYPDASHDCRRAVLCKVSTLRAVGPCEGKVCATECPVTRDVSLAMPVGDAEYCEDDECVSPCNALQDGLYADRAARCREYFMCAQKSIVRRGACAEGRTFSNGVCLEEKRVHCPPAARSPCFSLRDGLHRDWRSCDSWLRCRKERVVGRGSCAPGLVFNGELCVSRDVFSCQGPSHSPTCVGRPTGLYQDLKSNCTFYYHCEQSMRTDLSCGFGDVFDGVRCVSSKTYLCPSLDGESCYNRPDGKYRDTTGGCRSYYMCIDGERATFACPLGSVFEDGDCVPDKLSTCLEEDYSCSDLEDGYHADVESNCKKFFYCESGDRLATLSCQGGKIFKDKRCVDSTQHQCSVRNVANVFRNTISKNSMYCQKDGVFVQTGTDCKSYFYCLRGDKMHLSCPPNQQFNGHLCVPHSFFNCLS